MIPSAQIYAAQNAPPPPPPPTRTSDPLSTGHSRSRPPYFDPATGMRYDTNNGSYEGWLTKQSEWLKDWRRRWFILKGDKLFFAKSNYSVPHGMVDLSKCQTVKSAEHKAGKKYAMEVRRTIHPVNLSSKKRRILLTTSITHLFIQSSCPDVTDKYIPHLFHLLIAPFF